MANPAGYSKALAVYKQIETRRQRALRRLFELSPEDIAFFMVSDGAHTRAAVQKRCKAYYAALVSLLGFEKGNQHLRTARERQELTIAEVAFLLTGAEDDRSLPNKLREARMRTGLSQEEVAMVVGISRQELSAYERGIKSPDLRKVMHFSFLYGVDADELFRRLVERIEMEQTSRKKILARWRTWRSTVVPGSDVKHKRCARFVKSE